MASQRARNASELAMAVHSDTVRAPEAGLEDLLGTMALTKPISFLKRFASVAVVVSRLCCIAALASLICGTQLCAAYMLSEAFRSGDQGMAPMASGYRAPLYRFCHERFSRWPHLLQQAGPSIIMKRSQCVI
ncbi:hypothetical protein BB934_39505 (plasmid) [Microvirga ossetica]|uniref:Uncharacterized protein n=1 Tax=Microvirga ossetica TaxID=1882682 RepID=A0A1B2EWG7_9HYPH|nr:hypothetical protein BB934_39505 [Microvirga ossetica]